MSAPCTEAFRTVADRLGGISCDADAVLTVRAPWNLENWTLPVVELLVLAGAALGLVHAVTMLRRERQPAWLALWVATVVYVVIWEPPLYFPESFGLGDHVGLTFVHNVFSVEFLFDRLPLYIVALYPCGIYLTYALVDRLGVFTRHGIVVGAVTAGAVHHCFYEIFDHLGPQLRWWGWNTAVGAVRPSLASVPYSSMVIFAAISPAITVGLARWLLFAEPGARSPRRWALRAVAVGVLTTVLTPIITFPLALTLAPDAPNEGLVATVMWATLVVMAAVALHAVLTSRPVAGRSDGIATRYPAAYAVAYLATFAVLWATALPDLLSASDGFTSDGTPVGQPLYALGCALACALLVRRATAADATGRLALTTRPAVDASVAG